MTKLVIVESPSKSKTIQKYLGKDFEVLSSKGHINDLATSGKGGLGVDVDSDFTATYKVHKDKKTIVKELKDAAKKVDQVFLATDPDREGEAISWHLANELKLNLEDSNRVIFNEITEKAVKAAFEQPRPIDMNLVKSQETRRIVDRIIGFRLSTLLQRKIKSKSAGRVQSVAVRLIVEREAEIDAFVPVESWSIKAEFEKEKIEFMAELDRENDKTIKMKNKAEADRILSQLDNHFIITGIENRSTTSKGKFPFTTSALQQEAATKLSFAAKKTMRVAQKLYEGVNVGNGQEGLITYMRTDSTRLSNDFVMEAQALIKDKYGDKYLGAYKVKNDENAQDAHEAIRPTHIDYDPESIKEKLSADEYRLYSLIYARTLASLMTSPKSSKQNIYFTQKDFRFVAKGSKLTFDGYLIVYAKYDTSTDELLPHLEENEALDAKSVKGIQSFTTPPARYTEAKLIDTMEKNGIGRPSTYASTLDTIVTRNYVLLQSNPETTSRTKYFFPTDEGKLVNAKLLEFFDDIINVEYTKNMEEDLDKIAEGQQDHIKELHKFYNGFQPMYEKANIDMEKLEPVKTGRTCPKCESELVERKGRFGVFVACSNYPECDFVEKPQPKPLELTGDNCPDCGKPLVKRMSRFGKEFIGCSGYPGCRFIQGADGKSSAPKETGEKCPDCGSPLVERMSRYGKPFVGCSAYPKCRYIKKEKKNEES